MRNGTFARSIALGAVLVFAGLTPVFGADEAKPAAAPDKDAPATTAALVPSPLGGASLSITPFRSSAVNVDDYKKHAAGFIVGLSGNELADSLPPILKSVVVLDITVDAEGNIARLAVWRSNGFKDLEQIAMQSVRRAGKLPAPSAEVLKGQESVRYLETWLFRHDGRYHVRSVVPADLPVDSIQDLVRARKTDKRS